MFPLLFNDSVKVDRKTQRGRIVEEKGGEMEQCLVVVVGKVGMKVSGEVQSITLRPLPFVSLPPSRSSPPPLSSLTSCFSYKYSFISSPTSLFFPFLLCIILSLTSCYFLLLLLPLSSLSSISRYSSSHHYLLAVVPPLKLCLLCLNPCQSSPFPSPPRYHL